MTCARQRSTQVQEFAKLTEVGDGFRHRIHCLPVGSLSRPLPTSCLLHLLGSLNMSPPSTTTGQRLLAVIERPFIYARRAVRAAAYPLQGIYYFLRHPDFYPLFYSRLIPLSVISFLVYTALFFLVFWPQYLFLVIFHGWGAWPTAIILFLGEGLVIIQGLFEGFFVDECRVDVFDVGSFATFSHYLYQACLSVLIVAMYAGDPDKPRAHRSGCASPPALPRCPELRQDAWQAHRSC